MRIISDENQIKAAMIKIGIDECLGACVSEISILEYDRQELVMSPVQKNENMLFLFEGSLFFYLLEENGKILSVTRTDQQTMLGDEELFDSTHQTIFVEAKSRALLLAIPYARCKKELEQNIKFLQIIIRKIYERNHVERQLSASSTTIREKFLFYLQYLCPESKMSSVNEAAETLGCSCRQLHRVLKELTEEGIICHTGKANYRRNH